MEQKQIEKAKKQIAIQETKLGQIVGLIERYIKAIDEDGIRDSKELKKLEKLQSKVDKLQLKIDTKKKKFGLFSPKKQAKQGKKISIKQVGNPKQVKPEYKGDNFDYAANAEKIRHYNNNLTDGGHYYGSDHKIAGMVHLYKQPTHEATYRVVCRFANADQINAWNDRVDKDVENINTAKSIVIGLLTTFVPVAKVAKWVGMGARAVSNALAISSAVADNKLFSISAKQVGLSPNYQLTTQTKITTIRSTTSREGYNGVDISISIRVEKLNGKVVEEAIAHHSFKDLDPFGTSKFDRANDQVLRMFENQESYEEIVGPERTMPYLLKLSQRD